MATTHHPPPFRHLAPARPIGSSQVLSNIQSYLAQSTTNAYLHPDCMFVEREGPTFSSTASTGGVVLQQLRRVEAGLRGEWMGVNPGFGLEAVHGLREEEKNGERHRDEGIAGRKRKEFTEARENTASSKRREVDDEAVDEPYDEEDEGVGDEVANYQEQLGMQGEVGLIGEIGARSNVVGNLKAPPRVHTTGPDGEVRRNPRNGGDAQAGRALTKEERRAAKKAKRKEENKERAEIRRDGNTVYDSRSKLDSSVTIPENLDNTIQLAESKAQDAVDKAKDSRKAKKHKKSEVVNATKNETHIVMDKDTEMVDSHTPRDQTEDDRTKRKEEKRARKLSKLNGSKTTS